jgi:hypothetical protein
MPYRVSTTHNSRINCLPLAGFVVNCIIYFSMSANSRDTILERPAGVKQVPDTPGFRFMSEDDRLLLDAQKTGLEKLQEFTLSIRRNAMFNKAIAGSKNK